MLLSYFLFIACIIVTLWIFVLVFCLFLALLPTKKFKPRESLGIKDANKKRWDSLG